MRDAAPDLSTFGLEAESTTAVAGGDSARAWRAQLADGTSAFVKQATRSTADMLPLEAAGLAWLAEAGAVTPRVLAVDDTTLVLSWVERAKPSAEAATTIGAMLARMHRQAASHFGCPPPTAGPATKGWVGTVEVPFGEFDAWPQFYVAARLQPAARTAQHLGGLTTTMRNAIDDLCDALLTDPVSVSGPATEPAVTHGDLWAGNVMWTLDGGVLVDPAAVGGHPETDLAMLQLFGAPQWARIVAGYEAVGPLAPGWQSRVPLHQVFPLLVHAAMFGAGYGAQAASAPRTAIGH